MFLGAIVTRRAILPNYFSLGLAQKLFIISYIEGWTEHAAVTKSAATLWVTLTLFLPRVWYGRRNPVV